MKGIKIIFIPLLHYVAATIRLYARRMTSLPRAFGVVAVAAALLAGMTSELAPSASAAAHAAAATAGRTATTPRLNRNTPTTTARPSAQPTAAGELTGTVLGAAGLPLSGACVTVTGPHTTIAVRAGATGQYFIGDLRAGSYTVSFADCASPSRYFRSWYGGSFTAAGAAHVLVIPGRSISLGAVSLQPTDPEVAVRSAAEHAASRRIGRDAAQRDSAATSSSYISGTVRSAAGRPLAGICVFAWANVAGGQGATGVVTGKAGKYTFAGTGLLGRKVTVEFTTGCGNHGNYAPQWWKYAATEARATTLTVPAGHHLTGIDAKLTAGGEITGTVRADNRTGRPLRGICVMAASNNPELQPVLAATGANGSYLLKGLATGSYQVQFQTGCGNNGNYIGFTYGHQVRVHAGKVTRGVNAVLQPGGTISGTVTSATTSAPVGGVCVLVATGDVFFEAQSGANGGYSIDQLPVGGYQVEFSGGCGNSGSYAPQVYPDQANPLAATLVRVGRGQTRSGIDASMAPGATISGKVTNAAGHGVANVCPLAITPQDESGLGPGPVAQLIVVGSSGESQTSVTGNYTIANLAPGPYYVQFFSCFGANLAQQWYPEAPDFSSASVVSAGAGTVTSGIDAVMSTGGTITGTVRNAAGKLLASFCALAVNVNTPASLQASLLITTSSPPNMHGRYSINQLTTGDYKVEFVPCFGGAYAAQWYRDKSTEAAATIIKVTAGRVTSGINGVLHAAQSLSGTVTSGVTGKPLAGVCVFANDAQGNTVEAAQTGSRGRYDLPEMPAGTYNLVFFFCAQISPALAPVTRTDVRVSATKPSTGVNAVLHPGGSIAGTVLGETGSGSASQPEPGICVEATPKTGDGADAVAVAGVNGDYKLTGLAAGTYSLLFTADCLTATEALAPYSDPSLVTAVPGTTVSGINATLQADGEITGTVTNTQSQGLAGICVTAVPATSGISPVVAVTAGTGSYTLGTLLPGSYTVEFSAECGATGYQTQWWDNATSQAAATPVPVPAGSTVSSIDATLTATP
jgi:hypothetical protein